MTQESKKIFYTFLLDKAALQVIDCSTLPCTAITVLLIFIKRSECSKLNSLWKILTQTGSMSCAVWSVVLQATEPHTWNSPIPGVCLLFPQTADFSTHTEDKAACKETSSLDNISFLQKLLISHFCPVCWLSPDGALISLSLCLLTLLAYSQALFLHQGTRSTLFSNMTFLGDQDNKKASLTV